MPATAAESSRATKATGTGLTGLVWFRRDLRTSDHVALSRALQSCSRVWCVFVFDEAILESLRQRGGGIARRVAFLRTCVVELAAELERLGGGLIVLHDRAETAIPRLARELDVGTVYFNRDYEPAAIARDATVAEVLRREGRDCVACKDQVVFERDELLTATGKPFSVFTPYKNAWLKAIALHDLQPWPVETLAARLIMQQARPSTKRMNPPVNVPTAIPSLETLGFGTGQAGAPSVPAGMSGASQLFRDFLERIDRYQEKRDYPAAKGPSYLSTHLRFGTISIRTLVRAALECQRAAASPGAATWLSELIWRDFYFQILHHHPHVAERAFKPEYDAIRWEEGAIADAHFAAWCAGRTGYPLVDAAMAQINSSGYMHNRLRMVAASFLVKDLGIDWRRGERYFADHLIDHDLAANNGGWQWAASTGCDAQPWFRIFNPVTQSERFDPQGRFIKRYLPQLANVPEKHIHAPWRMTSAEQCQAGVMIGRDYPAPLVQHDLARERTLERYAVAKSHGIRPHGTSPGKSPGTPLVEAPEPPSA